MSSRNVSKAPHVATIASVKDDDDEWSKPDFIYGGPFIKVEKEKPFLDTATPINIELQGTFKKFVYVIFYFLL